MELSPPETTTALSLATIVPSVLLMGVATAAASVLWLFKDQPDNLPPGPPVYLPGLGNLLKLAGDPVQALWDLRERYGDVFRLYLGSQLVVVLNGYDVVKEVLITRGSEFSFRPDSFLKEKIAEDKGILNTNGPEWHEQKINVLRTMRDLGRSGGRFDQNVDAVLATVTSALKSRLGADGTSDNMDVTTLIRRSVCCVSFATVYGRRLSPEDREIQIYTDKLNTLFNYFGALAVVNFLPCVQHLPGDPACYHACLDMVQELETQVVKPELRRLTQEVEKSEADESRDPEETNDCLVACYLREMIRKRKQGASTHLTESQLLRATGDLMAGSYDPVSTTVLWMLLYLSYYPEVQERCHKEAKAALDQCQGQVMEATRSRLLNYTAATVLEVQRLANVVPFIPSHSAMEDSVISGYHLPRGTTLLINTDSMMKGPHVGEDWEDFRPERFLDSAGCLKTPDWFMPYGAGPRICVGAQVSKREILAFTSSLLAAFKFSPAIKNGRPCEINLVGELTLTHMPKPFTLSVACR